MKEKLEETKLSPYFKNVCVALKGLSEEIEKTKEACKKWMLAELEIYDTELEEKE